MLISSTELIDHLVLLCHVSFMYVQTSIPLYFYLNVQYCNDCLTWPFYRKFPKIFSCAIHYKFLLFLNCRELSVPLSNGMVLLFQQSSLRKVPYHGNSDKQIFSIAACLTRNFWHFFKFIKFVNYLQNTLFLIIILFASIFSIVLNFDCE